ncbi:MAG: hypothetical protein M1814_006102 [Vezdaea aestivalis]|nr:MAG: hypothetical protein M1814_006102 [Vezdaea aestivalis]
MRLPTPTLLRPLRPLRPRAIPTSPLSRPYATQGYGNADSGFPAASDPHSQGPSASEHLEHPGPPPPKEGQTGGEGGKKEEESGKSAIAREVGESEGKDGKGQGVEEHNRDIKGRHDRAKEQIG